MRKNKEILRRWMGRVNRNINYGVPTDVEWIIPEREEGALGYTQCASGSKKTKVHVAYDHPIMEGLSDEEKDATVIGVDAHEVCHQLMTDGEYANSRCMEYQEDSTGYLGIPALAHYMFNVLEDPAIEYQSPAYFGGIYQKSLRFTIRQSWKQSPEVSEMGSGWNQLTGALIMFGDMGLVKGSFTNKQAEECFNKILPLFNEGIEETDPRKRVDIAMQCFEISRPLWEEECKQVTEMINLIKELKASLERGGKKPDFKPMPMPSSSGDGDAARKRRIILVEKVKEKAKACESGDESEAGAATESGETSEADVKDEKESGESGSEKSGEKADSSSAGERDEEESGESGSGKDGKDAEGSEEPDASGSSDTGKGGNAEGKASDESGKSGKTGSAEGGKKDDESRKSSDGAEMAESKGSRSTGEAPMSGSKTSGDDGHDGKSSDDSDSDEARKVEEEKVEKETEDELKKALDSIRDDLSKEIEREKEVEKRESKEDEIGEIPDSSITDEELKGFSSEDFTPAKYGLDVDSYGAEDYAAYKQKWQLSAPIHALTKGLERVFKADLGEKRFTDSGEYDIFRGYLRTSEKMFTKKIEPSTRKDAAVLLLIDNSGSMRVHDTSHGTRIDAARNAAIIMGEALKKNHIPYAVVGFSADEYASNEMIHFVTWKDSQREMIQLLAMEPEYNNFDSYAIRAAGKMLSERPERHKYLFVVSDGLPEAYAYGYRLEGLADTKKAVKQVSKICNVFGLAIGSMYSENAYMEMYGKKYMHIDDPMELGRTLSHKLEKVFKRSM